ncbi:pre-mRNA-splicing factor SYF2 [Coemansia sp. RSA 1286]|nr:pre-mRNA-splicing factor SYF2 [Coemansia sp. RSA 1286]
MADKKAESIDNEGNELQPSVTTEQHQEKAELSSRDNGTSSSEDDNDGDDDDDEDESSDESDDSDVDITERTDIPEALKPQIERLRALRARMAQSAQENKREIYKEHQRRHENPGEQRRQERKRQEAEKLKRREEYAGDDYERSRFMKYSIDEVQKYEEKKAKAEANTERGFTDYAQVNQRKYEREVAKIKPDLAAYRKEKEESKEGRAGNDVYVPDPRKVDKLVKTVEEQQRKRAKLHKPSIGQEGEDVSYINDRNARFNRKMNRAYDKYTKDIKDNFERGTAM